MFVGFEMTDPAKLFKLHGNDFSLGADVARDVLYTPVSKCGWLDNPTECVVFNLIEGVHFEKSSLLWNGLKYPSPGHFLATAMFNAAAYLCGKKTSKCKSAKKIIDGTSDVLAETLFGRGPEENKVVGYRLFFFFSKIQLQNEDDISGSKKNSALLQALRCSLIESESVMAHWTKRASKMSREEQQTVKTQKKRGTGILHAHHEFMVCKDPMSFHLQVAARYLMEDKLADATVPNGFDDERFKRQDGSPLPRDIISEEYLTGVDPRNIANVFSPEAAMVYHSDRICDEQVNILNYFSEGVATNQDPDDLIEAYANMELDNDCLDPDLSIDCQNSDDEEPEEDNPRNKTNRLSTLLESGISASNFRGVPFANHTFRVASMYTLCELLHSMPLPYKLGSEPDPDDSNCPFNPEYEPADRKVRVNLNAQEQQQVRHNNDVISLPIRRLVQSRISTKTMTYFDKLSRRTGLDNMFVIDDKSRDDEVLDPDLPGVYDDYMGTAPSMGPSRQGGLFEQLDKQDVFRRLKKNNRQRYRDLKQEYHGRLDSDDYGDAHWKLTVDMLDEYNHEFFNSQNVSRCVKIVREWFNDLPDEDTWLRVPYVMEERPYTVYRAWINSYLKESVGMARLYKIAVLLYFARLSHGRYFPDNSQDPNINVLLAGHGCSSKSHMLNAMYFCSIPGSMYFISHISEHAFHVGASNLDHMCIVQHEKPPKSLMNNTGKGSNVNEFIHTEKDRINSHRSSSWVYQASAEKGKRGEAVFTELSAQGNQLAATNENLSYADQNMLGRYIVVMVPKISSTHKADSSIEHTKRGDADIDVDNDEQLNFEHQLVHLWHFYAECAFSSGVIDNKDGVLSYGGTKTTDFVLDELARAKNIKTNNHRKRGFAYELERTQALHFAQWLANGTCMADRLHKNNATGRLELKDAFLAALPFCVVTKDQVVDSLGILDFQWFADYENNLLGTFLYKMTDYPDLDRIRYKQTENKQGEITYDNNYLTIVGDSPYAINSEAAQHLDEYELSTNNISAILKKLSDTFHECRARTLVSENLTPLEQRDWKQSRGDDSEPPESKFVLKQWGPIKKRRVATVMYDKHKRTCELHLLLDYLFCRLGIDEKKASRLQHYGEVLDLKSAREYSKCDMNLPMIAAIRSVFQNKSLENTGMVRKDETEIETDHIRNDGSNRCPFYTYVTPYPPRSYKLSGDVVPPGEDGQVSFHDLLSTIDLERTSSRMKPFENHTRWSMSSASLARYERTARNTGQLASANYAKKKQDFAQTSVITVDEDMDYVMAKKHLDDLHYPGFPGFEEGEVINFPPNTYRAITVIEDEHRRNDTPQAIHDTLQYPAADVLGKIVTRRNYFEEVQNANRGCNSGTSLSELFSDRSSHDRLSDRQFQKTLKRKNGGMAARKRTRTQKQLPPKKRQRTSADSWWKKQQSSMQKIALDSLEQQEDARSHSQSRSNAAVGSSVPGTRTSISSPDSDSMHEDDALSSLLQAVENDDSWNKHDYDAATKSSTPQKPTAPQTRTAGPASHASTSATMDVDTGADMDVDVDTSSTVTGTHQQQKRLQRFSIF